MSNSLSSHVETILSNFISADKKFYSPNHVLLRRIENWKNSRNNNDFVGTVLMDLLKAFNCIPHDLLAAKLYACGLSEDAVTFVLWYLKCRKQGLEINDTESVFQTPLSGIPQGSTLGPILFNILVNDIFSLLKTFNLDILQMIIRLIQPGLL